MRDCSSRALALSLPQSWGWVTEGRVMEASRSAHSASGCSKRAGGREEIQRLRGWEELGTGERRSSQGQLPLPTSPGRLGATFSHVPASLTMHWPQIVSVCVSLTLQFPSPQGLGGGGEGCASPPLGTHSGGGTGVHASLSHLAKSYISSALFICIYFKNFNFILEYWGMID